MNEARSGIVVCQRCGKTKEINLTDGGSFRSGIAKCACSNTFQVIFENRRHYRKPINLYGKCFAAGDAAGGASAKLVDISRTGIRFIKMDGRPLRVNEKIRVSFSLGEETVFCAASVYNVSKESIGAKFISLDEHSKKVLGFFLLP